MNFDQMRTSMVEGQVRVNDVTDERVISAFGEVARERFLPKAKQALAYSDMDLEVTDHRWALRARDLSKMLQACEVAPTDAALVIGCARGYPAALMGALAESVIATEDQPDLVNKATEVLLDQDITNVVVIESKLAEGAAAHGPYDVILFPAGVEHVPDAWLSQLADGGRLVTVLRKGAAGHAVLYTRDGDAIGQRRLFDSGAPLHPGFVRPRGFAFAS